MWIDRPTPACDAGLRELWTEAFGADPAMELFFRTAYSPDRCRCVTVDGAVAGALYWFDVTCQGRRFAYLYAVATRKAYRGRGLCRELMDYVTRCLVSQGYDGILLVPGELALASMYEKMGFRFCTTHREFFCAPDPDPAPCHRVDVREYGLRRRALLPAGSVLQEGESLAYLNALAEFYEGANFLLAAVRQDDHLLGLELLGDAHAASGILRSLGMTRGTFRTPGSGCDFAMYRPLTEDCPKPAYLGFAFE